MLYCTSSNYSLLFISLILFVWHCSSKEFSLIKLHVPLIFVLSLNLFQTVSLACTEDNGYIVFISSMYFMANVVCCFLLDCHGPYRLKFVRSPPKGLLGTFIGHDCAFQYWVTNIWLPKRQIVDVNVVTMTRGTYLRDIICLHYDQRDIFKRHNVSSMTKRPLWNSCHNWKIV